MTTRKVEKTDEQWRAELSDEQYAVLRRQATEAPFTSDLLEVKEDGTFRCAGCGAELFSSRTKYDSGTGWPSFYEPVEEDNVVLRPDTSHGMIRTEVVCGSCGGHLGHVFDDGPQPTGLRYCINGCALTFDEA
ncbi:MAG TPA: peptide-methionine (R)-S-oxide reductase MsrB [Actinomycetota bacterium]|jgi:peptide-methionine (R)-S-oxide reductase|nr:peptide-methionine (R)-S-oxide reductase MsrB [Actinomycetota bacterium]